MILINSNRNKVIHYSNRNNLIDTVTIKVHIRAESRVLGVLQQVKRQAKG